MAGQETSITTYKSLYNFIAVLDETQVHKLHKVVSGVLDISAFSSTEIEQLEKRLSHAASHTLFIPMTKN